MICCSFGVKAPDEYNSFYRYLTEEDCVGGEECTGTWFAGPYGPCSTEDKCGEKGEMKRWVE